MGYYKFGTTAIAFSSVKLKFRPNLFHCYILTNFAGIWSQGSIKTPWSHNFFPQIFLSVKCCKSKQRFSPYSMERWAQEKKLLVFDSEIIINKRKTFSKHDFATVINLNNKTFLNFPKFHLKSYCKKWYVLGDNPWYVFSSEVGLKKLKQIQQ